MGSSQTHLNTLTIHLSPHSQTPESPALSVHSPFILCFLSPSSHAPPPSLLYTHWNSRTFNEFLSKTSKRKHSLLIHLLLYRVGLKILSDLHPRVLVEVVRWATSMAPLSKILAFSPSLPPHFCRLEGFPL